MTELKSVLMSARVVQVVARASSRSPESRLSIPLSFALYVLTTVVDSGRKARRSGLRVKIARRRRALNNHEVRELALKPEVVSSIKHAFHCRCMGRHWRPRGAGRRLRWVGARSVTMPKSTAAPQS
ncbi:hypothetical protein CC80DRAFT_21534 [Byssothecium circinans]|uniref:Uncharacterized protein n=1 Tax=Byssothecium circinans TaxID=147558 RepID=A0A6A5U207_9PLEO|nr:hypothetical protein CC80DRAFT_21534 [Byssothecium circinans]